MMIDAFRAVPMTGAVPESEYPRDGCPWCRGPVKAVIVTCDLDEDHERYQCQLKTCDAEVTEYELITVDAPTDDESGGEEETLDVAALLKAGRVMPALRPWAEKRVKP